ncbi:MAG: hypothetical protein WCQ50_21680 [Spirochaetota bacterium]
MEWAEWITDTAPDYQKVAAPERVRFFKCGPAHATTVIDERSSLPPRLRGAGWITDTARDYQKVAAPERVQFIMCVPAHAATVIDERSSSPGNIDIAPETLNTESLPVASIFKS